MIFLNDFNILIAWPFAFAEFNLQMQQNSD